MVRGSEKVLKSFGSNGAVRNARDKQAEPVSNKDGEGWKGYESQPGGRWKSKVGVQDQRRNYTWASPNTECFEKQSPARRI